MEALREKLRMHRSTRSWVATCERRTPVELEDGDRRMREALELQSRIASALLSYADAVANAFESLVRAHTALEEGGLFQVDEAAATAKALLYGFREAHSVAQHMAAGIQVPLEAHRATLLDCMEDLSKADAAEAEVSRYNDKVEALADSAKRQNTVSSRAEAKLTRNREKLQSAKHSASVAQGCARDAMTTCMSRQANLCQFARKAVSSTSDALRRAVARLDPALMSAVASEERTTQANSFNSFQAALGNRLGTGLGAATVASDNPFNEDYADAPPRSPAATTTSAAGSPEGRAGVVPPVPGPRQPASVSHGPPGGASGAGRPSAGAPGQRAADGDGSNPFGGNPFDDL